MNIHYANGINPLRNNPFLLFRENLISSISSQHKKIIAAATAALGLFIVCLLAGRTKFWSANKNITHKENEKSIPKTLEAKTEGENHTKSAAEKILEDANAENLR